MSKGYRLPPRLFADFAESGVGMEVGEPPVVAAVWERLLENGTREDLRHWLDGRSREEIAAWLRERGERLSGRSWAFWSWLLSGASADDLPARGDNPYWPDAAGDDA